MSIQQGKGETAHDYTLCFERVLEKNLAYEELWVCNLFIGGLQTSTWHPGEYAESGNAQQSNQAREEG